MTKPSLKIAPYGESNFSILRENNLAYVDKTEFIEKLELDVNPYPLIIRPRRFGKTLFSSTLQAYYDIAAAEDFDRNFAGTYIGENKTHLASAFRVLRFEFTGIDPTNFEANFITNIKGSLRTFCTTYNFEKGRELLKKGFDDPVILMDEFVCAYDWEFEEKIYLIIDEFDQIINDVLFSHAVSNEALTNAIDVMKAFFASLKDSATNGPIGRIFVTGVTSIDLDSLTSGFNIAENITNDENFTAMFGFSEDELRNLVLQLVDLEKHGKTLDEVISRMKEWFKGYSFNPDVEETVFNPSMCLHYLSSIADFGKEPENMLDPSVANSLDKIKALLSLGEKDTVREIVEKAIKHEPIYFRGNLKPLKLTRESPIEKEELLSALVYMGYLTFATGNPEQLIVPNRAIASQFFEYYFKNILKTQNYTFDNKEFESVDKALCEGNHEPWLRLVAKFSNLQ